MKLRPLGRTGFQVSEIGHGLWGMGGWSGSEDEASRAGIRRSIEGGCNFFDSAFAYGAGKSDGLIGGVAREYPGKTLYLASKFRPANWKWPSSPKDPLRAVFPRAHVLEYAAKIRESFGRPIDLLQFHVWEDAWAREAEWQDTVAELKEAKTIKAFGLSLNRWEPENGIAALETGFVDAVQAIYNIFDQSPEDRLFPACRKRGVGVVARVPLDEGSLGGNMTLQTRFPEGDWRARYFGPENLAATIPRVEALRKLVPAGMTLPEMALRFVLAEPTVSTLIVGMRAPSHIAANLALSQKGPLPADLVAALRAHRWDRKPAVWSD